ncbi:hypothetical protein CH92_12955 [Stutzerimonas stutzeri]|uniref:Peptidase inhibitor I78 family protein n=1 Tax=Stutzerimonas stutzeri TaxID=316 RepID=W8RV51_STUST|nr:I78 family peptidase inhibitor [Stutzerimonas stutzeri]AHL75951.1 hypothetical protein CH92_12955 [Stutzerimonas stutzeri]MCQ4330697.1 I78 family peptidase inhibitor [Stutzerimonas stutzeri]
MRASRLIAVMWCGSILLGCQSSPSEQAQAPQNATNRCTASAIEKLVGEQATPALLDQARRESGASVARILRPGDVVTLEYNAGRLNLMTDDALKIQQINCG